MTTVTIRRSGGLISTVEINGHSGYGEEGSDIVCAAITSAVRFLDCILSGELGLDTKAHVGMESVRITSGGSDNAAAQRVLSAFRHYMKELSNEYPENVRVMED